MNGQDPQDKERVQRNVAKMRAAGAPESEVLAYLQQEDSRAPQAPAEPTGPKPYSYGGGIPGLGMKGLTAGLSDEIAGLVAGAGALLPGGRSPGEAYRGTRDQIQAENAAAVEANPILGRAAEFGGAMMIPLGGAAKMLATGSLPARAAKGAGFGAGLGGLFGFGNATGTAGEQLAQTATGAGFGVAAGTAVPLVIAGATKLAQPAAKLGRWFGITTNSTRDKAARQAIEVALERTGQTFDDIRPRAEAALAEGRHPTLLELLGPGGKEVLETMGPIGNDAAGRAFKIAEAGKAGGLSEELLAASQHRPGIRRGIPSPYFKGAWAIRGADVLRNRALRREAESLLDMILQPVQGPGMGPTAGAASGAVTATGAASPAITEMLPAEIQAAVQTLKALGTQDAVIPQALGKMRFQSPEANAAARRLSQVEFVPPPPIPSSGPVGTTIEAAPQKATILPSTLARKQKGPTKAQLALHEARMAARRAGQSPPAPPGSILAARTGQAPLPTPGVPGVMSEADVRMMAEYLANPGNLNQPGVLEMLLRLSLKP